MNGRIYNSFPFTEFGSHLAITWQRNEVLHKGTSGIEFVFDVRQLVAIVGSSLIEVILDIQCVFTALKETESAVENIRVEHFSDDTINKSHAQHLMLIALLLIYSSKKSSEMHFVHHFNLYSDCQYYNRHYKVDKQAFVPVVCCEFGFDHADALKHGNEELFHVIFV